MCGFIVTNLPDPKLDQANARNKKRGPDLVHIKTIQEVTFLHNLLSITGEFTPQPFVNNNSSIVALFNGQIYNYKDYGDFPSDGHSLIPLYEKHGIEFTRYLDGEFAIVLVDFVKKIILLSSDVFGTKPLWYSFKNNNFSIASYKSSIESLGFKDARKTLPNQTCIYSLDSMELLSSHSLFDFDLHQHKTELNDFFSSFEKAVEKRTKNLREKIFIGLSSGHDSGALALALTRLGVHFEAYSILGEENKSVLLSRHKLLKFKPHIINLTYQLLLKARLYLKLYSENGVLQINPTHENRSIINDTGAIGLAVICSIARKDHVKIYLSGQGSDEIISDYGMNGKKLASHSTFAGIFPKDLSKYFPWQNFYGGAQESYLAKEEYVSGSYGIEGRYPFLDKYFVQEFLWLSQELKNKDYKYPLAEYMRLHSYPFLSDFKKGFVLGRFSLRDKLNPRNLLALKGFFE